MLRVTRINTHENPQSFKVEGRLAGRWVEELSRVASASLAESSRIVLDLSGLTFVDKSGLALLLALRARGVEMAGCSSFVASLLKEETP